jgi:RNA polymerase sigma-70 factor (ECF subfamily)
VNLKEESDARLLEALRRGEKGAFNVLYHRYRLQLYRFALRFLSSPSSAEDAVHETFLKLYRSVESLDRADSLRHWLFRVLRNEALMVIRRRHPSEVADEENLWVSEDPSTALEGKESEEIIQTALHLLKPEYREVILLREFEHLSYGEIARVTESSVSSVKSRLFKARRALALRVVPLFEERKRV